MDRTIKQSSDSSQDLSSLALIY